MGGADGWGKTKPSSFSFGNLLRNEPRKKKKATLSAIQQRLSENRRLFSELSAAFMSKPDIHTFLGNPENVSDAQLNALTTFHKTEPEVLPDIIAAASTLTLDDFSGKREYLYDIPGSDPQVWECTVKQDEEGQYVIDWNHPDYDPSLIEDGPVGICELAALTRGIDL